MPNLADPALQSRLERIENQLQTLYASAATINTPRALINELTCNSIRALDAQTAVDQPDGLAIGGGRCHSSLIGVDTAHTVQHHGGIGGTALNGEGGQLNFFGGDYRVPGCPPVLCGEIGYTWQFDYDLDPVSGLPRTPYALRLHSGVNPNTNQRTRLVLQGYDYASLESEFGNVIMSVRSGQGIVRNIATASSGNGLTVYDLAGWVSHVGNTPQVINFPAVIPLTKLARVEITAISKSTDFDSREAWKARCTWFATVVALIENFAAVGGEPSLTGRLSVTDNGTQMMVTCTGLADGKTRNTTVHVRLEIQQ